jgi:hypothetical protein
VVEDFTTEIEALWVAGTVAVDGGEVVGEVAPGAVPEAVAVSLTEPLSTSSWVTV